ncbi:MAG: STN domain-containing protein, partial [Sinobacterium sp.]
MRVLTRCLFTFFFAFNAVVVFAQSGGCKSEAVNQVNEVEARVVTFNVPSQNIVEALTTLAGQASCQLLFSYEVVDSLQSNEVVGRYTIQEALQILLTDTALSGRLTAHGVIVIGPINAFEKKQLRGRVMKSKKNLLASTIAFFVGSGMAPGVFAQADDAAAQRSQIDEIIVTATKRGAGTSIQDTAMAISSLSGD